MKQEKSANKPPYGGYQKAWINVKCASCSLMMGAPTEEWDDPPSPGLIFFQTSTQEVLHTEPINKNMKMGNVIIMHVGNNIRDAEAEARINENCCLINNQSTCNTFINGK